jgi:DNA polymerase elongation subunit (family B)
MIKIVTKYKSQIFSGNVTAEDITITQQISKMYSDYKTIPVHVQLAKDRLDRGLDRYYTSQKVPYIITSSDPLKVIHFKDFTGNFDKGYYWTNKIYPAVERVLDVCFPGYPWKLLKIPENARQQILSECFSIKVLEKFEGVVCDDCGIKTRIPALNGECKCGSTQLSFYDGDKIAKEVVLK